MSDSDSSRNSLQDFAEKHGLKVKQPLKVYAPGPHPDTVHVPGKRGWIRACDDGQMKLFVASRYVSKILLEAKALGMENQGRGDTELML
jgi:hypothetical protein